MTTCYSCKKEIGIFKPRGTTKDIIKAGYSLPTLMSEHDRLCQECLDEIKRTQTQGKKLSGEINMVGQIILCLLFPILPFWRIKKATKFFFYWLIVVAVVSTVIIVPHLIYKDSENPPMILGLGILIFYMFGWTVPLYWIIKWTKEYNKNLFNQ